MSQPTNNLHPKLERLEGVYDDNGIYPNRDEFSWRPCPCCGDHLGGERYEVKAIYYNRKSPSTISVMRGSFWVCQDCVVEYQ